MQLTFLILFFEGFFCKMFINSSESLVFSNSVYVMLIVFTSVILIVELSIKLQEDKNIFVYIILGYFFRLFLMIWSNFYSHIFMLPNSGADEYTFYYNAMSAIVKGADVKGYALIFTHISKVFGLSKLFGQYINVIISIFSIYVLFLIMKKIDISYKYKKLAILIVALIPNYAIISSLLLRESMLIACLAISLYFFVKWWYSRGIINPILSILFTLFATMLHSGVVVFSLGLAVIFIVSEVVRNRREIFLLRFRSIFLVCLVFVVGIVIIIGPGAKYLNYFSNITSTEDVINKSAAYIDGESAYNANIVEDNSLKGLIVNSPMRMLYFILSPMPWDWRGINDAIAFVFSGLFYAYTIIVSFRAIRDINNKNRSLILSLFIIAFLTMCMFGWGVSNAGTALRHRDKFIILYALMLVVAKDSLNDKKKRYKINENIRKEYDLGNSYEI